MRRYIRQKDLKILWGRAAGHCSHPDCSQDCILEADEHEGNKVLCKIAHIVAHSDTGPRGNPEFPEDKRNEYENLILLCPTHHDIVDAKPYKYDIATLQKWKSDHEQSVRESLPKLMLEVTFAELEVVTNAIVSSPAEPVTDFTVTDPSKKMEKNGLSERVHFSLSLGLGKAREVSSFVEHVASRDVGFPERLKAGFVEEYNRLWEDGLRSDDLFESLRVFSAMGSSDFKQQAAGLAVLCYLFEKCEVFQS